MRVVLASRSPRRLDLLRQAGLVPEVLPAHISEEPLPREEPRDLVLRLSREKARAVAARSEAETLVIGADTVVVLDGRIFGQPGDAAEAGAMLRSLSGRTHTVFTGVFLIRTGAGEAGGLTETAVSFHPMSPEEIAWYIGTGEPSDKAGAYAAQGAGALFLRCIEGSYHGVVGFPMDLFYRLLPEVGLHFRDLVPGK